MRSSCPPSRQRSGGMPSACSGGCRCCFGQKRSWVLPQLHLIPHPVLWKNRSCTLLKGYTWSNRCFTPRRSQCLGCSSLVASQASARCHQAGVALVYASQERGRSTTRINTIHEFNVFFAAFTSFPAVAFVHFADQRSEDCSRGRAHPRTWRALRPGFHERGKTATLWVNGQSYSNANTQRH